MQWADSPLLFIAEAWVGQFGIALLVEEREGGERAVTHKVFRRTDMEIKATINFSHAENFEVQIEISKFSKMVPKLDVHKYRKRCLRVLQSARG